jgi:N,N'-diacetylchitobiose transport system substrate-binding protein
MFRRLLFAPVLLTLCASALGAALRFQAWDYQMPGEPEFYQRLVADFEAAHPGDTVEFTLGQWTGAHGLVEGWVEAGEGPDLVVVPDIWIAEFADAFVPYADDLPQAEKDRFQPILLQKAIRDGHVTGLVWATSTKALFYRTDLFAAAGLEPPRDWYELLRAARRLHDPPRVYGIGIPGLKTYDTTDNFYFFFWGAGGEFYDENGRSGLRSDVARASLQFYVDLVNRYHVTQPEVTTWHRNEAQELFEQGRLAMFETGPWAVAAIAKRAPGLQYAVAALPVSPRSVRVRIAGGPPQTVELRPTATTQVITDHLMLMRYSKQQDLARKFIRFAYQTKYRQAFCELGMVPELVEVGQSPFFQNDPRWKIFVDIIPTGKAIPMVRWEPVELAMQQALYEVFSGRRSVPEVLDQVAELAEQAWRPTGQ